MWHGSRELRILHSRIACSMIQWQMKRKRIDMKEDKVNKKADVKVNVKTNIKNIKRSRKPEELLLERLKNYAASQMYPFHMPGHKRMSYCHKREQSSLVSEFLNEFPNPYQIDITEIDGFDNLHHAEGILKESMEWAASLYGADKTYYLVNGSSGGILSAISAVSEEAGTVTADHGKVCLQENRLNNSNTILLSRNCHKSAYHGVFLNKLGCSYVYPQILVDYGVQGGLFPGEIEKMLETHVDISAVLVVSPTYDGIVSDIKNIAKIVHKYNLPLIVDEAHGAHFRYSDVFPVSALELGADVVIQSVHKTLPCLTQSALLHVKKGYIDIERLERYLSIYQSSSPSYILMAGIEAGIYWMENQGKKQMELFTKQLKNVREQLNQMKCFQLMGKEIIGQNGVFDVDISKFVISTRGTGWSGQELSNCLRNVYHLEMEMCSADYVTAIATVMDSEEGLERLAKAMLELDKLEMDKLELDHQVQGMSGKKSLGQSMKKKRQQSVEKNILAEEMVRPQTVVRISDAVTGGRKNCLLKESVGKISAEFIYLYPPGIPVIAPGEVIQKELLDMIFRYQEMGLPVQGSADISLEQIRIYEADV